MDEESKQQEQQQHVHHNLLDTLSSWHAKHEQHTKDMMAELHLKYMEHTAKLVEDAVKSAMAAKEQIEAEYGMAPIEPITNPTQQMAASSDSKTAGALMSSPEIGDDKKVEIVGKDEGLHENLREDIGLHKEYFTGQEDKEIKKHFHKVRDVALADDDVLRAHGHQQSLDSENFPSTKPSDPEYCQALLTLVRSPSFDYVVGTCIVLNSVFIGYSADYARTHIEEDSPGWFRVVDLFFTIFFAVELLLRMIAEREKFFLSKHSRLWNVFDLFVVGTAIVEECLSIASSTTVIRILRTLRLIRVLRFIRLMRFFNDLRAMVWGILHSINSLFWAIILLVIIMFVFAVYFTQAVTFFLQEDVHDREVELNATELEALKVYFGSILMTIYTLFKAISGGGDWQDYSDPLFKISPVMGFFFCFYIAFAVFAVLNVVTGVFVDNSIKFIHEDEDIIIIEQTAARQKHINNVRKVFQRADVDASGKLTVEEFKRHLGNSYVQAYFRQMDLDIESLGAEGLFNLLDFDGDGVIDLEEFVFGCAHLKGNARSLDLARHGAAQRKMHHNLIALHETTQRQEASMTDSLMTFTQNVIEHLNRLNKDHMNIICNLLQSPGNQPLLPTIPSNRYGSKGAAGSAYSTSEAIPQMMPDSTVKGPVGKSETLSQSEAPLTAPRPILIWEGQPEEWENSGRKTSSWSCGSCEPAYGQCLSSGADMNSESVNDNHVRWS